MKRLSKKFRFNGRYHPEAPWTKYDERLYDGINENDVKKVKSAMRKKGISCMKQDSGGSTALHQGCTQGKTNCVKIMLEAEKPDLTVIDSTGNTPMHVAAKAGHTDCMKYLIHYKSRLDIQDASSMTPLHYAVIGCYEDSVALLLKSGAPVNTKDKEGRTALTMSSQFANESMSELLCDFDAHLNSQDNAGKTALMYASENGLKNVVGILLSKGASLAIQDCNEKTAEDYAKTAGNNEVIDILGKYQLSKNRFEAVNGTNGSTGCDSISELDLSTAEDSLTLNSSSSFGEMEIFAEDSSMSPDVLEFRTVGPFENHMELRNLKAELKIETLKRTKAERDLRDLRLQLEIGQQSDEEIPVDDKCSFILTEIEKSMPSPLKQISSIEEEETPLVSSLRGEVNALEMQIESLKKDLQELNENSNSETKIPLTVYKALKESNKKISDEMKHDLNELQSKLESERDRGTAIARENEILERKLTECKDAIDKNDKKENMRQLNENISSLKVELSRLDQLKDENEYLREQIESCNFEKEAEIQRLQEQLQSSKKQQKILAECYDRKVIGYRKAMLATYQGHLDMNLAAILCEISKLSGCMITEL